MIPSTLQNVLDNWNEDEDCCYITTIKKNLDITTILFTYTHNGFEDGDEFEEHWQIEASGLEKYLVDFSESNGFEISDKHQLLWEYNETQGSLYVEGVSQNAGKLYFDLYEINQQLFSKYIPLNSYLNGLLLNNNSFVYSNGLLASGPLPLLEQYAACLAKNNLGYSIVGLWTPTEWDGSSRVNATPKKILLFSEGYFIAKDFSFSQVF